MYTVVISILTVLSSLMPIIDTEKPAVEADLRGAWVTTWTDESGNEITNTVIMTDLYFASTAFAKSNGAFVRTDGGLYTVKDNVMSLNYEFNSSDKSKVGTSSDYTFNVEGDKLTFEGYDAVWERVDSGEPGALAGAWLITGRKRGDELRTMTPGVRKTMKILSGTWFQWIAYNTETGEFFGTGGGEYTTKEGKYTEIIEFFSRDDSRVGASLQFDYELKDGQWHHSGLSSKGDPIYEIWSPRTPAM
jgi:hypothetical protein